MRLTKAVKAAVWDRDDNTCQRCGVRPNYPHAMLRVEVTGPQPAQGVDLAHLATVCRECRDASERAKGRPSEKVRNAIFLRDRLVCQLCGCACRNHEDLHERRGANWRPRQGADLTKAAGVLLLVPRAQGGAFTPDNLVTACKSCCSRKADSAMDAYQARVVSASDWEEIRL
jgi:5-methylcytosine-specific restriction endonuclease McrA